MGEINSNMFLTDQRHTEFEIQLKLSNCSVHRLIDPLQEALLLRGSNVDKDMNLSIAMDLSKELSSQTGIAS